MKRRIIRWLFLRIPIGLVLASLAAVTLLKWVPVRFTPLMLKRAFQFREVNEYHSEQEWVSLEDVSPELRAAVIAGEDSRFYEHHGFDWREIALVLSACGKGEDIPRGCSTISQQTAKNLFTFGTRTWARKAVEAWWTVWMESIWGKDRILEVYLNVVELGPGIYGVGAATKEYFDAPPGKVGREDAATLAACIPSPLVNRPGCLSPQARIRRRTIYERMGIISYICPRHVFLNDD
jgi:monofunctional biosynthetic peptidoglycan transglycosylase